ncbi:hypothetical protein [Roseiconus lacunae]|uniref:Carboxypeptidase regulatory-like domain-containing protein n=1 Tax=Roseiconus lacunae TaxID=2605694 RepID=A0ABT7PGS3_9BACT|nr:hypothetical protein [Roseiconus lacunae]MDM4015703.1 hypothetical protein [Roseiconus lacunae]
MSVTNRQRFLNVSIAGFLAGVGFLIGCSKPETTLGPTLYPVTGTLLIDGEPAVGATVKFVPVEPSKYSSQADQRRSARVPAATVQSDGSFQASYDAIGDGAPEGVYKLLVFQLVPPPGGGLPIDRFQGRFLDERRPIASITVKSEPNDCGVIRLSSSR